MNYWRVPPLWSGRTVAVLASGPSMSRMVADALHHLPRIAVNNTYLLAPDADVIYAGDGGWWEAHPEALACHGIKATIEPVAGVYPDVPTAVHVLRNTGRQGFDPDPGCLRTLNNSGACGVQIAAHGKPSRILLLGFDMKGGHWHGDHPKPLTNASSAQMGLWVNRFRLLAMQLKARGIDVVNCTPNSALDCFRVLQLDAAINAAREVA